VQDAILLQGVAGRIWEVVSVDENESVAARKAFHVFDLLRDLVFTALPILALD